MGLFDFLKNKKEEKKEVIGEGSSIRERLASVTANMEGIQKREPGIVTYYLPQSDAKKRRLSTRTI